MPDFEVFKHRAPGNRKQRGRTVTVSGRGVMLFSEEAWAALGSPDAVQLLVGKDPGERVVGFRKCERGEDDAHAVTRVGHTVSAAALLLKYLKHDAGVSRRYTLHVEDGLPPYIDLNEDAPVVTSNRRKAAGDA